MQAAHIISDPSSGTLNEDDDDNDDDDDGNAAVAT